MPKKPTKHKPTQDHFVTGNHKRGYWIRVTTFTPLEHWIPCRNHLEALQTFNAHKTVPGLCAVHLINFNQEEYRYTKEEGTIMGIASKVQQSALNPFISPSALAAARLVFRITGIRDGEYNSRAQYLYDIETLDGRSVSIQKVDASGNMTQEHVDSAKFTVSFGRMDRNNKPIKSRDDLATALRENGFPYDNDGQGCIIVDRNGFMVLTDADTN